MGLGMTKPLMAPTASAHRAKRAEYFEQDWKFPMSWTTSGPQKNPHGKPQYSAIPHNAIARQVVHPDSSASMKGQTTTSTIIPKTSSSNDSSSESSKSSNTQSGPIWSKNQVTSMTRKVSIYKQPVINTADSDSSVAITSVSEMMPRAIPSLVKGTKVAEIKVDYGTEYYTSNKYAKCTIQPNILLLPACYYGLQVSSWTQYPKMRMKYKPYIDIKFDQFRGKTPSINWETTYQAYNTKVVSTTTNDGIRFMLPTSATSIKGWCDEIELTFSYYSVDTGVTPAAKYKVEPIRFQPTPSGELIQIMIDGYVNTAKLGDLAEAEGLNFWSAGGRTASTQLVYTRSATPFVWQSTDASVVSSAKGNSPSGTVESILISWGLLDLQEIMRPIQISMSITTNLNSSVSVGQIRMPPNGTHYSGALQNIAVAKIPMNETEKITDLVFYDRQFATGESNTTDGHCRMDYMTVFVVSESDQWIYSPRPSDSVVITLHTMKVEKDAETIPASVIKEEKESKKTPNADGYPVVSNVDGIGSAYTFR